MREEYINFLIDLESALYDSLSPCVAVYHQKPIIFDRCNDISVDIQDDYCAFYFNGCANITIDSDDIQSMTKIDNDYKIVTKNLTYIFSS